MLEEHEKGAAHRAREEACAVALQRRARGHQARSRVLAPAACEARARPRAALPIVFEAGCGPADWAAPTAASAKVSAFGHPLARTRALTLTLTRALARAIARSRAPTEPLACSLARQEGIVRRREEYRLARATRGQGSCVEDWLDEIDRLDQGWLAGRRGQEAGREPNGDE
jgi:hypothetical protein